MQLTVAQDGEHPRAILLEAPQFLQPVGLPHCHLKSEPERLLAHFSGLPAKFVAVQFSYFVGSHRYSPACIAAHHFGGQRQLSRRQSEGFFGRGFGHAFHLEKNLARANHSHPLLGSAFAFSHAGFGRLLGDGLVGKQPDPNLAAALDETRHGHAGGFNLPVGDPTAAHGFQTVIAESKRRPTPGFSGHAPALLFSVFHLLGHQHESQSPIFRLFRLLPRRLGRRAGFRRRGAVVLQLLLPARLRRSQRRQDRRGLRGRRQIRRCRLHCRAARLRRARLALVQADGARVDPAVVDGGAPARYAANPGEDRHPKSRPCRSST